MKYISVAVLLVLLSWTWSLATTPREFSLEMYDQYQAEFEDAIRSHIQARRPDAKDVIFHQLYTEAAQPGGEVRAHFRYQIDATAKDGDTTEEFFEGTATRRSPDEGQTWEWQIEEVASPILRYREGIKVTPNAAEPNAAEPTEPASGAETGTGAGEETAK